MNKWQIIDYLHHNNDWLDEADIWRSLDQINDSTAIKMMNMWLYNTTVPGDVLVQALGIMEWYDQHNFLTTRQRRYLLINMVLHWDKTKWHFYSRISSVFLV